MTYQEIICEVPQLIPPTDFNMSDDAERGAMRRQLDSFYPRQKVDETDAYVLWRASSGARLVYFYMLTKADNELVYFVKCEVAVAKVLGEVVTQVGLWRDRMASEVQGVTSKVFRLLLAEFDSVLSDAEQTVNGQDFWIRQMADAASRGLSVGLFDSDHHTVEWRAPEEAFRDWMKARMGAWSTDSEGQRYRFIISGSLSKIVPMSVMQKQKAG